jgi:Peptidase family S41/N-terminal domain of Peptidase_S41 in eukaryotic IRBP
MSEKVYAWLFRLFPAHFREEFGAEALLLFRDRARDERGLLARLRLWLDLMIDLVISIPRVNSYLVPELLSIQPARRSDRMFLFRAEGAESPRPAALLFGSVLSLAALGVVPALINHFGNSRLPTAPAMGPQRPALAAFGFGILQNSQSQANGTANGPVNDLKLDNAEKQRVIDAVIANLKEHYVYPDLAEKIAEALAAREKAGDYEGTTDGRGFAALLTKQLRDVSHDMHLEVVYSRHPIPNVSSGPSGERPARYRRALEESNCTFEKIQILPHNIGYLKLNSFADPSICRSTAKRAMASLNNAAAVIFDLRDNRGGYPGMVMLLAAYLFDHPEYMYNPRDNTTEQSWTRSPVPGNKLADKPVYVLTSSRTFSAAEHFSYNLKMLKRATLVGETTGGATDVGAFHRIDDHFGMGIRETRGINPYSEPDWAVTGVQPDVIVNAADALRVAEKLAEQKPRAAK